MANRAKPSKLDGIRVLICSSQEALPLAKNLQRVLMEDAKGCEVKLWPHVFALGMGFLDALTKASKDYDFFIMLLTPDDERIMREHQARVPRDNIVFETGLFTGKVGLQRVILLRLSTSDMVLLTDLNGITRAEFHWQGEYPIVDGNNAELQAALREKVLPDIVEHIENHGKKGLREPLNQIDDIVAKIETKYRQSGLINDIFLKEFRYHIEEFLEMARSVELGRLPLRHTRPELLPKLVRLTRENARGVAHFKNIRWWTSPEGEEYLKAHGRLRNKVKRLFLVPLEYLGAGAVLTAITANYKLGIDVRILPWRNNDSMLAGMEIDGISLSTDELLSISHTTDELSSLSRIGWQNVEDELSFIIIDGWLVSYSNITAPDRERPSLLTTHLLEVQRFIDTFDNLFRIATPAKKVFPNLTG